MWTERINIKLNQTSILCPISKVRKNEFLEIIREWMMKFLIDFFIFSEWTNQRIDIFEYADNSARSWNWNDEAFSTETKLKQNNYDQGRPNKGICQTKTAKPSTTIEYKGCQDKSQRCGKIFLKLLFCFIHQKMILKFLHYIEFNWISLFCT